MDSSAANSKATCPGPVDFQTTRWSVVLKAGQTDAPSATEALAALCEDYWPPVYAFVQRRGYPHYDALDLTQGFFAYLIEKHSLQAVRQERGRFRSFLLKSVANFLKNEYHKRQAVKRGGRCDFISLNDSTVRDRFWIEPSHGQTAEKLYEQQWALRLLEKCFAELAREFAACGDTPIYEALQVYLTGRGDSVSYRGMGLRLGLTETAVKARVHRLRQRFGQLLRNEVAQTVTTPEEVGEELRHLFEALG